MRFVIQRVSHAKCTVEGQLTGEIRRGFCVFIGVTHTDTSEIADKMLKKMLNMRIFEDAEGKTNLALSDVGGSVLLISQFTLYANCRKGNRPSFTEAGDADKANELYEYIIEKCKESEIHTQTGIFGADMKIDICNEGPFTIVLDSDNLA